MSSVRQQTKTLAFDVVLMVVAGFAPAIGMGFAGWSNGVNVAILSGLAIFIACMGGTGWRTGLFVSLPFAILAGLADWAGSTAVWRQSSSPLPRSCVVTQPRQECMTPSS